MIAARGLRDALALSTVAAVCLQTAAAQTATLRPGVNEDPKVRAEAVALLERSVEVSTPSTWTDVEINVRFHVGFPAPGEPNDGEYQLIVGDWWMLRRHEWKYGAYHMVLVRNGDIAYTPVSEGQKPTFANLFTDTIPIDLVRFNGNDVIRSINRRAVGSTCIDFDIVAGDRQQDSEICVDDEHGWLISKRVGDVRTINSNFVPYRKVYVPAHVERWVGGQQQFIFEQQVVPKSEFPADFFDVPASSPIRAGGCREFRRAQARYAPQPEPLSSSPTVTDVEVEGYVGTDGHVAGLKPVDQLKPDLNKRAMEIVAGWTFAPATCDGAPSTWFGTLVVHFRGAK